MESLSFELNRLAGENPSVAAVLSSGQQDGGGGDKYSSFLPAARNLLFVGLCISALATAILVSSENDEPPREKEDSQQRSGWARMAAAWITVALLAVFGVFVFVLGNY